MNGEMSIRSLVSLVIHDGCDEQVVSFKGSLRSTIAAKIMCESEPGLLVSLTRAFFFIPLQLRVWAYTRVCINLLHRQSKQQHDQLLSLSIRNVGVCPFHFHFFSYLHHLLRVSLQNNIRLYSHAHTHTYFTSRSFTFTCWVIYLFSPSPCLPLPRKK